MAEKKFPVMLVGALFFVSGVSGLIYEVLWTRSLTLVFGNTVVAVSTVLAAFMGGLAIGAWTVGRFADRVRKPLLLYALLEALIAVLALLFPLFLDAIVPILQSLYRAGHTDMLALFRFLAAFLFLLIPTAAMGGTLPTLGRLLAKVENAGITLGWLYGINTLGATLGALFTGFWLLPAFGLTGTRWIAVALNILVALGATGLMAAWKQGANIPVYYTAGAGTVEDDRLSARHRVVLWAFLFSGAIALALEVLWTRSLLLVFGSTVYSFSTMLTVFLLGLAIGSVVVGMFVENIKRLTTALGIVEAGIAFVTLISISRVNELPSAFLDGLIKHGMSWDSFLLLKFLIAGGILFPVALLFGATFPIVARMEVFSERKIGGSIGILYAFNTVGAIAGSLLAGFVLLPRLGLQKSLMLTAGTALLIGIVLLLSEKRTGSMIPRVALALLLVVSGTIFFFNVPAWSRKLLSAGVYFHPVNYLTPDLKQNELYQELGSISVLDYVEGMTETAAVIKTPISRQFIVDGKVEASTLFVDMRLQKLQGILPCLFSPRFDKSMNIGLGCGITLGGLKAFPFKQFQCVELEKKILTTAPYFAKQNLNVLEDPRLKVIINDGRNHLLLTDQKYDVITSDPFEPLVGGAASLYTLEHFENGRKRLSKGGVFAQYLPLYQLSPDDYRMIIRTFCRVFPHVTLWYTGIDSIMLGSMQAHTISLETLRRRMAIPSVRRSLDEVGITDPAQLLQTFVMDPSKVPEINNDGTVNSDRHPYIEFSAPRSHVLNTIPTNLGWLIKNSRPQDLPLKLNNDEATQVADKAKTLGKLYMKASLARYEGSYASALDTARRARLIDPQNRAVLYEVNADDNILANNMTNRDELDAAKKLLDEALSTGRMPRETYINLASWAFRSGDPAAALKYALKALDINPGVPDTNLKVAQAYMALHRPNDALPLCDKAIKLNPCFTQAILTRGDIALKLGRVEEATDWYARALEEKHSVASGNDWRIYGALLAKSGKFEKARKALLKAVRLTPSDGMAWYELARVNHALGRDADARRALRKAKSLAGQ